jgi:hypothetical protein
MAVGVSMHTTLEASLRTRERFPPLRRRRVATGMLQESFGLMRPTGESGSFHITLWVRLGVELHPAFTKDGESPEPKKKK